MKPSYKFQQILVFPSAVHNRTANQQQVTHITHTAKEPHGEPRKKPRHDNKTHAAGKCKEMRVKAHS